MWLHAVTNITWEHSLAIYFSNSAFQLHMIPGTRFRLMLLFELFSNIEGSDATCSPARVIHSFLHILQHSVGLDFDL